MKNPVYRWVCTICGISDEAESSEMARLNIDLHAQVAHVATRSAVKVQPDPDEEVDVPPTPPTPAP
jgi:hypothetical protein